MPKLILGLAGMPGAGKGTVAKYIQEKYGSSMFRFSTALSDLVKRLFLPTSRENLIKMSEAMRQYFGEDILAQVIEKDASGASTEVVVIDGARRVQDLVALEPLPHFKLIAVIAAPEIRFKRLTGRGEHAGETSMTWEQFQAEEQAPTEVTIADVIKRAAETLDNSGDLDTLKTQVDALMTKYGIAPAKH